LARFSHIDLELALSLERFGRYLAWAGGDRERAIELYTLNTRISESLYTPLQSLEVALRNRIHLVMAEAVGDDGWFHHAGVLLNDRQPEQLTKAIDDLKAVNKTPTPGRIVAALSFGFWTAMFGPDYEGLWRATLRRIAARPARPVSGERIFPARLRRSGPYATVSPTMSRSSCGISVNTIRRWSS
jgi:hypothetical protein